MTNHEVRTVASVLEAGVRETPEREVLRIDSDAYSYSDLNELAHSYASAFAGLGVSAGDRVLVMLPNGIEFIGSWLGLSLLNAVEVPVNTAYRGTLLEHLVQDSAARYAVVADEHLASFADLPPACLRGLASFVVVGPHHEQLDASGPRIVELDDLLRFHHADCALPTIGERDVLALMYTSGTTGASKGVLVAQRHAYMYAKSVADLLNLGAGDVYYAPLPLFHVGGQWAVVYASLQTGATAVIRKRFSASEFLSDVRLHGATVGWTLGAMAQLLVGQEELPSDLDNPLERMLMTPLISDVDAFRTRFGVEVFTCYGSTEANVPIVSSGPATGSSCGKVRDGFELAVVDDNDEVVGPDTVGELLVRPAEPWTTMIAYEGNASATAEAYRNAWLHTGDLFSVDRDGNYHFIDRKTDSIRRRGENISSFEVEREVNSFPGVVESAAVGVSSEFTEQEVKVFIAVNDPGSFQVAALEEYLQRRLPRFMIPSEIEILAELPKTATGKITKAALREK